MQAAELKQKLKEGYKRVGPGSGRIHSTIASYVFQDLEKNRLRLWGVKVYLGPNPSPSIVVALQEIAREQEGNVVTRLFIEDEKIVFQAENTKIL